MIEAPENWGNHHGLVDDAKISFDAGTDVGDHDIVAKFLIRRDVPGKNSFDQNRRLVKTNGDSS